MCKNPPNPEIAEELLRSDGSLAFLQRDASKEGFALNMLCFPKMT